MKRKILLYGTLIGLILLLGACNPKGQAFLDYNNDFLMDDFAVDELEYLELREEYQKAIDESNNDLVVREEFITDKVLPASQALLDKVKRKKVEDDELQDIHDILVESEEIRHSAVEKEIESVKVASQKLLNEAEATVAKADEKKQEFIKKREEYAEKNGVEFD